jgi:hypothetical protein
MIKNARSTDFIECAENKLYIEVGDFERGRKGAVLQKKMKA